MFTESKCVRHIPCPKCRSRGQDSRGDNMGIYDDGHGHCFSCGFMQPPKLREKIKKIKQQTPAQVGRSNVTPVVSVQSSVVEDAVFANDPKNYSAVLGGGDVLRDIRMPNDFTPYQLPNAGQDWIDQYGITAKEIELNEIGWSDLFDGVIFPVYNNDGKLLMYQARQGFRENTKDKKRYHNVGFPANVHYLIGKSKNPTSQRVVLVEDMISAIKVGRHLPTVCLFGSQVESHKLALLSRYFKDVTLWLDYDKKAYVIGEAMARCGNFFPKCSALSTTDDPKVYDDAGIRKELGLD